MLQLKRDLLRHVLLEFLTSVVRCMEDMHSSLFTYYMLDITCYIRGGLLWLAWRFPHTL